MLAPHEFLSFMIRSSGDIVPTMPDDEEFSIQQIRDYVAGTPEVLGQTHDGYLLFQSKEGREKAPKNEFASAMYSQMAQSGGGLFGRVFLAHPAHVAPYWRQAKR
jgi:hypothetical protein